MGRRIWVIGALMGLALLAAPARAGLVLKVDMNGAGGDLAGGWQSVRSSNRFDKPIGHAEETADLGGGVRGGYGGWLQGYERNRGEDPSWTFSQEYKDVMQDFSHPQDTNARLIFWNLPAGDYIVKTYMRDWQYGGGTYGIDAHDGTQFRVLHSAFDNSDPESAADTHTVSTILYDPDGAGTNYDAQPSIWFTNGGSYGLNGLIIEEVGGDGGGAVPEPGSALLMLLGGVGAAWRRRR